MKSLSVILIALAVVFCLLASVPVEVGGSRRCDEDGSDQNGGGENQADVLGAFGRGKRAYGSKWT